MTKHLVDIDDALLARAQAASGEKTIRATVEAGLKKLAHDEAIQAYVARLRSGVSYLELSPEEMRALREPRIPLREDDDAE